MPTRRSRRISRSSCPPCGRPHSTLLEVLNDALDLSKARAGKLSLREAEFPFEELLLRVLRNFDPEARRRLVRLRCFVAPDIPRVIVGDQLRLSQVLTNLIGNALKFTPEGGEVFVEAVSSPVEPAESPSGTDVTERYLRISVRDTGIGIPADRLESIFAPFEQADVTTSHQFGGSGLGLAICGELVELMRGIIWAASEPSGGSSFHVVLPYGDGSGPRPVPPAVAEELRRVARITKAVVKEAGAWTSENQKISEMGRVRAAETGRLIRELGKQVAQAQATVEALRRRRSSGAVNAPEFAPAPRVLVAEDNEVNEKILTRFLDGAGVAYSVVRDGASAVKAARGGGYDLVLMDCRMPLMDGIEAARRIRAAESGGTRRTPIVALTADAFDDNREECLRAGMDDHLSKPFSKEQVLGLLVRFGLRPAPAVG